VTQSHADGRAARRQEGQRAAITPDEAEPIRCELSTPQAAPEGYNRRGVRSLQIDNPRQRALVRLADAVLTPVAWWPSRPREIHRILLLRLERIGDLLMTLEAIADVRAVFPSARIDLAVGSWNEPIAALIPGISTVHVADVPWLTRGEQPTSWGAILRAASAWRAGDYDLVVNFEPDIRSNLLARVTGAPIRLGYASGGGGPLLTHVGTFDPATHVSDNARRLVATIAPAGHRSETTVTRRLAPRPDQIARVEHLLAPHPRPLIGVHVSGGRASKQWHPERFAAVAAAVAATTSGTIVLTGATTDLPMVSTVQGMLTGTRVLSLAGALDLPESAALLDRLDVLVTGDTGPMHLAAAMGTPVVALFGPSDPARYGPRARSERILRVQLPCSPCGQVRLPPVRCRGKVPDCMDGITVAAVVAATLDLLDPRARAAGVSPI
jgi:ADP-heptose:LPS heptosyltransferase